MQSKERFSIWIFQFARFLSLILSYHRSVFPPKHYFGFKRQSEFHEKNQDFPRPESMGHDARWKVYFMRHVFNGTMAQL